MRQYLNCERPQGGPMANAQCSCGALTVSLSVPATRVLACHCLDCQRVTGSPFLLAAFYPAEAVTVSGSPKEFTRSGGSGATVHQYFCSNCGLRFIGRTMRGRALSALQSARWQTQSSRPPPFRFSSSQNMTGFRSVVPLSTTSNASHRRVQAETLSKCKTRPA